MVKVEKEYDFKIEVYCTPEKSGEPSKGHTRAVFGIAKDDWNEYFVSPEDMTKIINLIQSSGKKEVEI